MTALFDALNGNVYPGRGIFMGVVRQAHQPVGGNVAILAYFIMGRSENSRNRIFVEDGTGIRTQAFDEAKVSDPSLIIYSPVRTLGNKTIVTNGDQTDTIYEGLDRQMTFEQSLRTRTFEPDAPNYTPRISGVMRVSSGGVNGDANSGVNYALSIIKRVGAGEVCREMFAYENAPQGEGRLIHTYTGDGEPLPSFEGEPVRVSVGADDIDVFTQSLWQSLNAENRVSLWVRYINIAAGNYESRIVNKNK